MKKIISTFLFFLTLISCSKTEFEIKKDNLLRFLDKDAIENIDAVILIPISGCGSCIKEMVSYSLKNLDNKKLKFIIVGLHKKEIYAVYNDINDYKNKLTIDTKLILEGLKMVSTSPVVYLFEKGKIKEEIIINDQNASIIIDRIELLLNTNN